MKMPKTNAKGKAISTSEPEESTVRRRKNKRGSSNNYTAMDDDTKVELEEEQGDDELKVHPPHGRRDRSIKSLVIASPFLLFTLLGWTEVFIGYAAAYFSLLIAFTIPCIIFEIRLPGISQLFGKILLFGAFDVTLLAFILNFFDPSLKANTSDFALKPILMFMSLFGLVILYGRTFKKTKEIRNDIFERPPRRCYGCWCCWFFFVIFLYFLASIVIIRHAAQTIRYNREDYNYQFDGLGIEEIYAISNDNNPEQLTMFKCKTYGDPAKVDIGVVFWHGHAGQALDVSNVMIALAEKKVNGVRMCSYNRQGMGKSRVPGEKPRAAPNLAREAKTSFEDVSLGLPENLIFVGHSMASYLMLVYGDMFPQRLRGVIMIDPGNPAKPQNNVCSPDEGVNWILGEVLLRLLDSGIGILVEAFGVLNPYFPIDKLPDSIQNEYYYNVLSSQSMLAVLGEARSFGLTCFSAKNVVSKGDLPYELNVIVAQNGYYKDDLSFAFAMADLSPNATSTFVPDAEHIELMFDAGYGHVIAGEIVNMVIKVRQQIFS